MKRFVAVTLIMITVLAAAAAQEKQLSFSPVPRFWGATVFGRYSLEPPAPNKVETSIVVGLSSAYESVGYYRNPDGSMFADVDDDPDIDLTAYNRFDLWWQLGIQQGILSREDLPEDLAVVFAYYRGRYNLPFRNASPTPLYFDSGLPTVDGGLLGSVHAGLAFSNIVDNDTVATRDGVQAELVLQWGPTFLHNEVLGSANFARTTLSGRYFVPLYRSVGKNAYNRLSVYLAAFGALDWATGPDVPLAVRSTFGTRSERWGMGGSVRGFETGRFDATLKAVANVEIRANLPTIVIARGLPHIVPGLLVYTDAGYFNDTDLVSPVSGEESGSLLSSGAGVYLDVRGIAEVIFYTNYLWEPTAVDGRSWVPFLLGFGFHY